MPVERSARSSRRLVIGSAAAVAVAVLGLIIQRWFAGNSIPRIEPFDVEQFTSVSVKPERNAIPLFREAAAKFVDQTAVLATATPARQQAFSTSFEAATQDWKLANADVRGWLEANRPAMEIWKRGSRLDDALDVPSTRTNIVTDLSLSTEKARMFTRLALLEAARLTSQGHVREAWEWYRAALRTSR